MALFFHELDWMRNVVIEALSCVVSTVVGHDRVSRPYNTCNDIVGEFGFSAPRDFRESAADNTSNLVQSSDSWRSFFNANQDVFVKCEFARTFKDNAKLVERVPYIVLHFYVGRPDDVSSPA